MGDKIFLTYVITDIVFVVTGGFLIAFALTTRAMISKTPTIETAARNLILQQCPLDAAVGNAFLIFLTFLISVPAMIMPMSRGWLKLHGYMTAICALVTMVVGLTIWFETLKTRSNLSTIWNAQPATTQSLIQQQLSCCGYQNSTTAPFFVQDPTCPNAAIAAETQGCVGPYASFANNFLDLIFTGAFGFVGIDVALILTTSMVLKDRKEKQRYRIIDEKNGAGAF